MADDDPRRTEAVESARESDRTEFFLLRWVDRISEVTGYVSGVCILLATLIICYAVIMRAAGQSTTWQTELAVYLLIFVTFVGGAYGLKHGSHVHVDLLAHRLSERGQLVLQVVRAALSLVLIAVVAWSAYEMWWKATVAGSTSGTAWDPPLTYIYAILPLGMVLMGLQCLAEIVRATRDLVSSGADDTRKAGL